jgi:hypothetical protein
MFNERLNAPTSRWISVTFLQGEDADEVLRMIKRNGAAAAIKYLQQWDFGDETTDAALTNGYVYDHIPAGSTDRTIEDHRSPYALTYSAPFGYVSLLRRYANEPEPEPVSVQDASATQTTRARRPAETWVTDRGPSANKTRHAVAL